MAWGCFGGTIIFIIFGPGRTGCAAGLRLRRHAAGAVHARGRRHLHQGGRCRAPTWWARSKQGLEEDDPRNAAVIADLVGDNVGDCAGMAADIFESYEVTIVSALILGLALVTITGNYEWIVFPLLVRGIGVISSIIGTYLVRVPKGEGLGRRHGGDLPRLPVVGGHLRRALCRRRLPVHAECAGRLVATVLAVTIGVVLAILIDRVTEYFTATHGAPVQGNRAGRPMAARRRRSLPVSCRATRAPCGPRSSSPPPSSPRL